MKPGTRLLLVDDDDAFRLVMGAELERIGFEVESAATGAAAVEAAARLEPSIVLLDLRLPDMDGVAVLKSIRERSPGSEVVMLTGHGSIDGAIESVRAGAADYVAKPCPIDELEVRIQRALERRSLRERADLLERGLTPADPGGRFVGASPGFLKLMHLIDRTAPSDATVLISGETGAGKEMVAKALHARSPRKGRPFVVVECAALQEDLLQSELFGHERGAFTGADRAKPGLFEVADGGTIFLDEIGEVSPATQVKLLRVLDASTFRHVGGTSEIRVDVRVIAATNRDLTAMVRQNLFREDLFYRLSTITLEVPPLRARRQDIGRLAEHFVARLNERYGVPKRLDPEAIAILERHDWPGNVRELLHAVEAAFVVSEGTRIEPDHLPAAIRRGSAHGPASPSGGPGPGDDFPTLRELERRHVERALRLSNGHRGNAAKMLGISERNLYRKLGDYGLLS